MNSVEKVPLEAVRDHENSTGANVRLGGYDMQLVSPPSEFRVFKATLADADTPRLFLLGITEFAVCTRNQTCRIADLIPEDALRISRVDSFVSGRVDLPSRQDLALLIVAAEFDSGPMIIIDGNHRAMAQYATWQSMEGMPAFLCIHPNIFNWNKFVPNMARVKR